MKKQNQNCEFVSHENVFFFSSSFAGKNSRKSKRHTHKLVQTFSSCFSTAELNQYSIYVYEAVK